MMIEIEEQTAAALDMLREQAAARELSLEAYLKLLADAGGNGSPRVALSAAETDHFLDELSAGETLPVLPADFSRADIYAEHD
ncbi:MAG: hypothetical protein U0746_03045 [Gemmataceae bacterium]